MQQNPARPWKTHFYFSNPPVLLRKIPDRTYRTSPISPISPKPISPIHDATKGDFHSSSRRRLPPGRLPPGRLPPGRLPPGMMPFGERPQISVGVGDDDFVAVVVNEEVFVVRPFARKIDHHLG